MNNTSTSVTDGPPSLEAVIMPIYRAHVEAFATMAKCLDYLLRRTEAPKAVETPQRAPVRAALSVGNNNGRGATNGEENGHADCHGTNGENRMKVESDDRSGNGIVKVPVLVSAGERMITSSPQPFVPVVAKRLKNFTSGSQNRLSPDFIVSVGPNFVFRLCRSTVSRRKEHLLRTLDRNDAVTKRDWVTTLVMRSGFKLSPIQETVCLVRVTLCDLGFEDEVPTSHFLDNSFLETWSRKNLHFQRLELCLGEDALQLMIMAQEGKVQIGPMLMVGTQPVFNEQNEAPRIAAMETAGAVIMKAVEANPEIRWQPHATFLFRLRENPLTLAA